MREFRNRDDAGRRDIETKDDSNASLRDQNGGFLDTISRNLPEDHKTRMLLRQKNTCRVPREDTPHSHVENKGT